MRANVKSPALVVDKWQRRASSASDEYRIGVEQTSADWAALSTAAAAAYKQGVQEAAGAGRYERGIAAAGTAKWKDRAARVGPMRFSQGVQEGQGAYTQGIGPVLQAIGAVDLPPRGPVGSDGNFARVAAIGKALRQLRTGRR